MHKNADLIADLERRARSAPSLAEGQRLFLEAAQLRRTDRTGAPPTGGFSPPVPRN